MEKLSDFKLKTEIEVRWGDMDAFQHVNNTIYLKWAEHARVRYFNDLVGGQFIAGEVGPILARQDCRYLFPVTYPDRVIIGYRTTEIAEDRLQCECRIYSKTHNRLVAIIYNTMMAYDSENLKKTDLPEKWLRNIRSVDFPELEK